MLSVIEERIVTRALWAVFFGGHDLSLERLAAHLPGVQDLTAHLERLADAGWIEVDRAAWRIYGACWITLVPTDHSVRLGSKRRYARSLEAAVGLMAELEESGYIETRCPRCGQRLTLRITRGEIRRIRSGLHDWRCTFRVREAIRQCESAPDGSPIDGPLHRSSGQVIPLWSKTGCR